MAITVNKEIKGIQVNNAYIRIDRIFGGKKEGWNSLVGVYANAEATEPIEQFNCPAPYDKNETNPFVIIYGAIKQLEGFEQATDC